MKNNWWNWIECGKGSLKYKLKQTKSCFEFSKVYFCILQIYCSNNAICTNIYKIVFVQINADFWSPAVPIKAAGEKFEFLAFLKENCNFRLKISPMINYKPYKFPTVSFKSPPLNSPINSYATNHLIIFTTIFLIGYKIYIRIHFKIIDYNKIFNCSEIWKMHIFK